MGLNGKIALVTGASRSIGRAIAMRLAKDGAMVCVHYVANRAAAEETVGAIVGAGGQAFALQADMGSMEDVARLAREFKAELKTRTGSERFDILVNNAAIAIMAQPDQFAEDQLDRVFDVNFKGPLLLIKALMDDLNDEGRIINISSATTQGVFPQFFLYTAAKSALNNLTVNLAKHLSKRGITVNAVAPGLTDTDMNAEMLTPQFREHAARAMGRGRIGLPQDIADVVSLVASEDAHWMTGQYLAATGAPL